MSKLRSGFGNDRRRYKCYCKTPLINIVSGQGSIYSGNASILYLATCSGISLVILHWT